MAIIHRRSAQPGDTSIFNLVDIPKVLTPAARSEYIKSLTAVANRSYVDRRLDMLHTQDPEMLELKAMIRLVAYRSEPVLITGPTGTGKELLASACVSPSFKESSEKPIFVAENCGGINRELIQTRFFGAVKGAYTGADKDYPGLLQEAGNGVVFLDEIGDLPLENQSTLLRAIQENEIRPVGSIKTIKINCRFVAATKYDLESRVSEGTFREDLYARISVFRFRTSSLQERPDDIPYIASKLGWSDPLPPESISTIYKYNVRGLQRVIANLQVFGKFIP